MIVIPYTFQCKELLFVLGRMLPPPELSESGTVTQAASQLANTLQRNVVIVDHQELLVTLDDPVEAVSIAREHELRIERCIAAPLALELLRESGDPAREAWGWLQQQLDITDSPQGIVKLKGLARTQLPECIDQIPDRAGVLLWLVTQDDAVELVDGALMLGRDGVIVDEMRSQVHAAIVPYRNTWAVEDRWALGLRVDGRTCAKRCLVPGMTIEVGSGRLVVLSVR